MSATNEAPARIGDIGARSPILICNFGLSREGARQFVVPTDWA
jgi:hypothetical protein